MNYGDNGFDGDKLESSIVGYVLLFLQNTFMVINLLLFFFRAEPKDLIEYIYMGISIFIFIYSLTTTFLVILRLFKKLPPLIRTGLRLPTDYPMAITLKR
ncbi:hypothetical protein RF11_13835 [Thelohanellus kitauei]|uniref:Uncharacterized protein n=1 Tax=Thelohanellus kitauei TaxID=669202 RepID=A0A0C2MDT8_THEKT|nr:hypothetical protein RF11_13835 [Thelohanellus kitauei]